jgi:hypothetical protein
LRIMLWAAFLLLLFAQAFSAQKPASPAAPAPNAPIWSKKGISFPLACPPFTSCRALRIASPDGKNAVKVEYERVAGDIDAAALKLSIAGKSAGYLSTSVDLVEEEIVWSPDSKCFFINGNYNGYVDEIAGVYCIDQPNFALAHIMQYVEEDMAHSFPPCRATYLSEKQCAQMAADPSSYLEVLALDWIHGSSEIIVMAEVPCDSMWGGIMCQVLGYEIAVPSGKILRRMEPKEFARRWQHSMAWKFRIPDPPEYKKN